MKIIFSLLFSLSYIFINAQNWYTDFDTAVMISEKEKKPILISITGSDWCSICKKNEKKIFSQDNFLSFAKDSLILLRIDFPEKRDKNFTKEKWDKYKLLMSKINPKMLIPTTIFYNKNIEFYRWKGSIDNSSNIFLNKLKELSIQSKEEE